MDSVTPALIAAQRAAWRSREERMRRIVKAWEVRALAPRPTTTEKEAETTIRRDKWPRRWPSRRGLCLENESEVEAIANGRAAGLSAYCEAKLEKDATTKEAFYVVDVGAVEKLYVHFREAMPSVEPFYAVKCFPNARVVETLARLGCGFDCASRCEAASVLRHADARNVIFANPCKRLSDIDFLLEKRIPFTTFDSVCEVDKIADRVLLLDRCPAPGLVLRIRADDPASKLPFGAKYGALPDEVPTLLAAATRRHLRVVGVSFHVGSGARTADAYAAAVRAASRVPVDEWLVLDIGGGMCGDFDEQGNPRLSASGDLTLPAVVERALATYFPASTFPRSKLRIIAEPGRYFAETSAALCATIIGQRTRQHRAHFWIADGVYGAFNAILYDAWLPHAVVLPCPHDQEDDDDQSQTSPPQRTMISVFGPTCDSLDVVFHDVEDAPPSKNLKVGHWLLFPNCGAYTHAGATNFNGIPAADFPVFYVRSASMAITHQDRSLPVLYGRKPPAEIVRYFD